MDTLSGGSQSVHFLITVLVGAALGFIFDFYRVMRGIFRPRQIFTLFFDTLYWLTALLLTFVALALSNWAEFRLYVFLGIIAGWGAYYKVLSRSLIIFFLRLLRLLNKLLALFNRVVLYVAVKPLRRCILLAAWPLRLLKRYFTSAKGQMLVWYGRHRMRCDETDDSEGKK